MSDLINKPTKLLSIINARQKALQRHKLLLQKRNSIDASQAQKNLSSSSRSVLGQSKDAVQGTPQKPKCVGPNCGGSRPGGGGCGCGRRRASS